MAYIWYSGENPMKDVFMIHFTLPEHFNSEMWDVIPAQRVVVNELVEKRVILNYSMDMERRNLWVFMEARDLKEVNSIIKTFPIMKFVTVRIHELAYYDTAPVGLPELILN
jgi:hypothetical protein